ncbi:MAG: hypothetical protein JWR88_2055 [Pseudonocardia sp.]|nr:hypothetical protein [Pseudonocardia sp.]
MNSFTVLPSTNLASYVAAAARARLDSEPIGLVLAQE